MKKYDAVIAGYTCVDMIPNFKKKESYSNINELLKPGKLIEIDDMAFVLGGAVPNTGLAMKKFNKKVFLNGLTGDDFIGKMAREYFARYYASEGMVTTPIAGTAFCIALAPPGVDRIFLESPGCNRIFDMDHINFEAVSQSRLFHFGYPPLLRQFFINEGKKLSQMFLKIQQMGVVTSLDFSLPDSESESGKINWPVIMRNTLPFVDIFVPSLEEALYIMIPEKYAEIPGLTGNTNIVDNIPLSLIRELGKNIIDTGVKILLIKAGERGAYLRTGDISSLNKNLGNILKEKDWSNLEYWCNAYKVDPYRFTNTSGAGDTAVAAFLTAILDGENPKMALKYANIAGRNNLYCHDIYSGLSDWITMTEEIHAELNEIITF